MPWRELHLREFGSGSMSVSDGHVCVCAVCQAPSNVTTWVRASPDLLQLGLGTVALRGACMRAALHGPEPLHCAFLMLLAPHATCCRATFSLVLCVCTVLLVCLVCPAAPPTP